MQIDKIDQSEEIKKVLREFAHKPSGFILLAGKNGTGKTYAAKACMNDYRQFDTDLKMFTTQTDLNLKWQKQIKDWGDTIYFLDQIIKTDFLVLDDLGTRIPTPAFMDFLYAIIDKRYNSKSGTIITTNLNSAQMREHFGDAIVSRIASDKVFRLEGNDRRFKDF